MQPNLAYAVWAVSILFGTNSAYDAATQSPANSQSKRETRKMLDDSVIMGLIVLLMCGAACFYLYMRVSFVERKLSMLEAISMDLKMAVDSIMSQPQGNPIPISPSPQLAPPQPLEASESEPIPEESFYSSILEQAHEDAQVTGETSIEKAMEGFDEANTQSESVSEPDFESMSKPDLLALAEKKGLRAKKSSSKNEIITLLRRSNPLQNDSMKAGAENVSGSIEVDLGQGDVSA